MYDRYCRSRHEWLNGVSFSFSDDCQQDISTTHAQMISMITELRNNSQLKQKCTIWESTDECYKRYRCGAFLNLLFLLILILSLII